MIIDRGMIARFTQCYRLALLRKWNVNRLQVELQLNQTQTDQLIAECADILSGAGLKLKPIPGLDVAMSRCRTWWRKGGKCPIPLEGLESN